MEGGPFSTEDSRMDNTPASLLVRLRGAMDKEAWTRFVHLFTPLLDRWARALGRFCVITS